MKTIEAVTAVEYDPETCQLKVYKATISLPDDCVIEYEEPT